MKYPTKRKVPAELVGYPNITFDVEEGKCYHIKTSSYFYHARVLKYDGSVFVLDNVHLITDIGHTTNVFSGEQGYKYSEPYPKDFKVQVSAFFVITVEGPMPLTMPEYDASQEYPVQEVE